MVGRSQSLSLGVGQHPVLALGRRRRALRSSCKRSSALVTVTTLATWGNACHQGTVPLWRSRRGLVPDQGCGQKAYSSLPPHRRRPNTSAARSPHAEMSWQHTWRLFTAVAPASASEVDKAISLDVAPKLDDQLADSTRPADRLVGTSLRAMPPRRGWATAWAGAATRRWRQAPRPANSALKHPSNSAMVSPRENAPPRRAQERRQRK